MVFFIMASRRPSRAERFVSELMCLLGAFQASDGWGAGTWGSVASGTETFAGATPGVLGPWYAAIAGVGMVIAAMYLLKLAGSVVWGPLVEPHGHSNGHANGHGHGHGHANGHGAGHGHDAHGHHAQGHAAADSHGELPTDLNSREIGILLPLAALCLFLGVYPKPLLHAIETPVAETAQLLRSTGGFNPAAPGGTERALVEADGATGEAKSDPVAAGTSMTESIGGLGQ
jgi:NADH:ubiquinone oxidoreductase subunit 4 (subunit M)